MNRTELNSFLLQYNDFEKMQHVEQVNIHDLEKSYSKDASPRMPKAPFFKEQSIYINRSNRFAPMPSHTHDFIELNYMYSGSCEQIINQQKVVLTQGQICLLDKDVPHSISSLGEEDILINILLERETISTAFLSRFANSHSIVSSFLINAASESQQHDRFIIFHSEDNENLQYILHMILCEYFDPKLYSNDLIQNCMTVVFTELMRVYQHDKNYEEKRNSVDANIMQILEYIESHFLTCGLKDTAKHFGFTPNYLSNLIKSKTGKTFTELITKQKMLHAASLLCNTELSIEEIAEKIGYVNVSFFYRKFKGEYVSTPSKYRRLHQKE
ncbi:helix-turn-helix domain-containing protein [Evansella sp. AB-rgal1]|uniref:AraC family transcriptional regulator n=1 Tax=Evansella sp. AB-rgal1 TaxID=3242696 RepID=UPI00359CCC75